VKLDQLVLASLAPIALATCCPSTAAPPPTAPVQPAAAVEPPPAQPPPPTVAEEPVPELRLPTDVHPTAEAIELHVDPTRDRFSGVVDIDIQLDRVHQMIWLHGDDFNVTAASVTPDGGAAVAATWKQHDDTGLASLTLASTVPAGKARIHVAYDAPFTTGQRGLYKATEAEVAYAFTQFESISARSAFPCFDEPSFKNRWTITLVVPAELVAIANTHEVSRTTDGGSARVSFAPTQPLPSYLVAFAVGAFDVVNAPDVPPNTVRTTALPLRAVTTKGRGKEVAYALGHTGEIVSTLETYFGIAYPWDKLDILAVPGKGGAMENAGAVTFGEQLLLMDEAKASAAQRFGYAYVMAHELAHQWTGDLVTMAWWDDTWLNEAFATWIGGKVADLWNPKLHANLSLLRNAEGAMNVDALVNARAIRQPIRSTHDILGAFDSITYSKGAGVLSMFERWAGPEVWQHGVHAYLEAHRFGNGTADDFLDAENAATGKDVKTAFHTFLDQPGVPFVEASLVCSAAGKAKPHVHLAQSRYLPLGSTGDAHQTWQTPVCVRTDRETACTLLATPEADLELTNATCPAFVFPNADGAGYYRFALAPADLASLRTKGSATLTTREKSAYEVSLWGAYRRGTTRLQDLLDAVRPLANDADQNVAQEPMAYISESRDWLYDDAVRADIERYGRALYAPAAARLGWEPKPSDTDEARLLRATVLRFLAFTGRDDKVRVEAKKRGLAYIGAKTDGAIHVDAVDSNLASIALGVVGEQADRATWDAMKALYVRTVDETVRGPLLFALTSATDPQLAAAARELVLDPALRFNEMMTPLRTQLANHDTRDAAWAWMKAHYDAIVARMPKRYGGLALIGMGRSFCDAEHVDDVEAFFGPKAEGIEGGPRELASTLEEMRLCVARRKMYAASAKALFGAKH
jgi:alanyl aminopeptidase